MPTPARSTYKHGNLPEALAAAVLELVAEKGVRNLSVAEAARRTGVSTGAPYRHYASRDDLLAAVAARVYAELVEALRIARRGASDPYDQLSAVVESYVGFAREHRPGIEIIFGAGLRKWEFPVLQRMNEETYDEFRAAAIAIVGEDEVAHRLVLGAAAVAHGANMLMLEGSLEHDGLDATAAIEQAGRAVRWMARGAAEAVAASRTRD